MIHRVCAIAMLVILASGCGSSGTPPTGGTTNQSASISIAQGGGSAVLPSTSTYSATLTYPSNDAPSGASIEVTATTKTGTALPGTWGDTIWNNHPLVSYIFSPSATITFNTPLTLAVDMGSHMPAPATGPSGILEIDATGFDLTAQTEYFGGVALSQNISGTTATFSVHATYGGPLVFTAGHTYQLVITYAYLAA